MEDVADLIQLGTGEATLDHAELIREARGQRAGDRFDIGCGYDEDFLVFRGTEDHPMNDRPRRFQVADVQVQVRDRAVRPAFVPGHILWPASGRWRAWWAGPIRTWARSTAFRSLCFDLDALVTEPYLHTGRWGMPPPDHFDVARDLIRAELGGYGGCVGADQPDRQIRFPARRFDHQIVDALHVEPVTIRAGDEPAEGADSVTRPENQISGGHASIMTRRST
ncbi:hypothetical protein [Kribbella jejuensis]|uniref:hypothetical protein n=1 Tax=Kribbella jejuensis TaxID=236068 RepID=UPI0011523494|nr:hypothetical protein [Kribbella jejuensis]